ncbi:MAG TPA: hypothetical protein VFQ37_04325 [Mycobacterium sp.]|nr:hypothetical protein [Mycobacterium sp.]
MPDLCTPTFGQLATSLGFSCGEAGGLVEFRSPFALENWTLPVLEATVIIGAVLALVYAIRRYRRCGDATNLVLWFGAIAYLLIIEPPLYFPAAFGIADHVDTMFAHNVFSVQFLWGRLPLYIVAIYPMMATVAFEIVRVLGVFHRYGTLVGAVCVGFIHHAFYEIFDHLGPQLRWWEWSVDNPLNQPMFDAVPMGSVVVFAALWPMSLAFCVQLFVGRHMDRGKRFDAFGLIWRTIVVGILASLGTGLLPLPATIIGALSGSNALLGLAYALELLALSAVAVIVLLKQWQRYRSDGITGLSGSPTAVGYTNPLIIGYAAAYLAVMAILWLTALPAYFGADHGVTSGGDPVGSLWYAVLCFVIAGVCTAAAANVKARPARQPVAQSSSDTTASA